MRDAGQWTGRSIGSHPDLPQSLGELFLGACARRPERPALYSPDSAYTYHGLRREASRFASLLSSRLNLAPGERLAVLLPNRTEWVISFFGATLAGIIVVPLDWRLTPSEGEQLLRASGAAAVVTTLDLWRPLEDAYLPALNSVIAVDSSHGLNHPICSRRNSSPAADPHRPVARQGSAADVAAIFYTSGSTGSPKGVMLTHSNIVHGALNAQRCVDLDVTARNLIAAPLSHVAPCVAQLVATLATGGTADLLSSFDTAETLRWMSTRQVTHFFGVPAMYRLLLSHPMFEASGLERLRSVAYGGAPCPPDLGRQLRVALPRARIGHGYGLTESSSVAAFLPDELLDEKPMSVGFPCFGNEFRVVGNDGQETRAGQPGELLISGPTVFRGYDGQEDDRTLHDGWLHTGDVARVDGDGCVYIVDRIKDMIIRGGENVYCVEVENVLLRHPAVADVALIGVPDEVMGEEGKAIVVLREGRSATPEELRQYCAEVLARFKVPRQVEFRDSLPRNGSGKLVKQALRRAGDP